MSEGFKTCRCLQALTGKHALPAAAAEHLEKIFDWAMQLLAVQSM